MLCISVGRYGHFSYSHIVSLWDRDKRYYRAWVGGGKRETLCTCHRLFHNYLVILNYAYVRKRACLVVGLVLESVFKTFPMRTRSINVQVYFTFHVPFRLTQLSKYTQPQKTADGRARVTCAGPPTWLALSQHSLCACAIVLTVRVWQAVLTFIPSQDINSYQQLHFH